MPASAAQALRRQLSSRASVVREGGFIARIRRPCNSILAWVRLGAGGPAFLHTSDEAGGPRHLSSADPTDRSEKGGACGFNLQPAVKEFTPGPRAVTGKA